MISISIIQVNVLLNIKQQNVHCLVKKKDNNKNWQKFFSTTINYQKINEKFSCALNLQTKNQRKIKNNKHDEQ